MLTKADGMMIPILTKGDRAMRPGLTRLIKEIQFNTPLRRYFFPRYFYNFTAPQLCFLCQCIEDTKHCEGSVAEVGCANGATTVFLNKYMDAQQVAKKYYAIDTFSGFVAEDIELEVTERGKNRPAFDAFRVNKKKWFDGTMRQNEITRVTSIEADVNIYDLRTLGCLSFVLLDVDLYRPMKKSLRELYSVLCSGGIMIVDDCDPDVTVWDGANQAYNEFMEETGQPIQVVHGKLGVVRKNA